MGRHWFWNRISWNYSSRFAGTLFPFHLSQGQGSKARRGLAHSNPYGSGSHDFCCTMVPVGLSCGKKPFARVKERDEIVSKTYHHAMWREV
jgi:hypothetical protein